ncbi:MAG: TlpA family protein disulfide reductase [Bacteroidales bacterium]|nr:TlpA family protein disulfide reductase [Bacteroidales bacterium]
MIKTLCLIFSIGLAISGCRKSASTLDEIVLKAQQVYEKHTSMSYDIDYRIKYFSDYDTVRVGAQCILIRDDTDTLFGGIIWFMTSDSIEKYYDLTNIYSINHHEMRITEYRAHDDQSWALTGNTAGSVYRIDFLDPGRLQEKTNDSSNLVLLTDTVLMEEPFWIVQVKYPDDPPFLNMEHSYWISVNTSLIRKITFRAEFQNEIQYDEWNISNIEFDRHIPEELKDGLIAKMDEYDVQPYFEADEEERKPLDVGTMAPDFPGIRLSDSSTVKLSDLPGRIVLLDFWYMSCFPCIQAIPHLDSLYRKYRDEGFIVLGLNPFDNDDQGRKKLPGFIDYNGMEYPVVFIDEGVTKNYKVFAYPTIYLIGITGKIIYSQVGFGEHMLPEVDSLIRAEIGHM